MFQLVLNYLSSFIRNWNGKSTLTLEAWICVLQRETTSKGGSSMKIAAHWAKGHGTGWVHCIPYHAPASGKMQWYNGLLKTTLRPMGVGTFKHWGTHLGRATCSVSSRGSASWAGHAQSNLLYTKERDKGPIVHVKICWGGQAGLFLSGKGKPIHGIAFAQEPRSSWVMQDEEVWHVPPGDLILGENSQ